MAQTERLLKFLASLKALPVPEAFRAEAQPVRSLSHVGAPAATPTLTTATPPATASPPPIT